MRAWAIIATVIAAGTLAAGGTLAAMLLRGGISARTEPSSLVPEMKGPKHPVKGTPVKLRATPQMAWGYTRTDLFANPAKPRTVTHILWSVYVLEPRGEAWKIVLLDWSLARH